MDRDLKHAFIIMAHGNWDLLARLIARLDDKDHILVIHIDKKSHFSDADQARIAAVPKKAEILFAERRNVTWGGYSMVQCELHLMQEALKYDFDYLHLLSGVDYPIKPLFQFHQFFLENSGKEFVNLASQEFTQKQLFRYDIYHLWQDTVGRSRFHPLFYPNKLLCCLQRWIPIVHRAAKYPNIRFECGSQWFSITKDFARYVLEHSALVEQLFQYSFCSDEIFMQTMLVNSPYFANWIGHDPQYYDYEQCLRRIDWKRGSPYVFQDADYDELIASPYFFCRKVGTATPEQARLLDLLDKALDTKQIPPR